MQVSPATQLEERAVSAGIGIFGELGFLRCEGFGAHRRIIMEEQPSRMELESSIRYLEGMRSGEEFHAFCDWVLTATPSELLARINRPILPGFGEIVREEGSGS